VLKHLSIFTHRLRKNIKMFKGVVGRSRVSHNCAKRGFWEFRPSRRDAPPFGGLKDKTPPEGGDCQNDSQGAFPAATLAGARRRLPFSTC
jgi:hypothetical protein